MEQPAPTGGGRGPTRRRLLAGGTAAVALVASGAVAGGAADPRLRSAVRRRLEPVPEPAPAVPLGAVGPVASGTFASAATGTSTGWSVAYPDGSSPGAALPVMLVLHGRGGDHRTVLGSHALGRYLSQAVRSGVPPFAVAGVDGGDHTYWHPRASGCDPQAMLTDELLPLLAGRGLRTDPLALGGWSMGGYGALLLAERLGAPRVAAVAVDSPAVWQRAADTAPGAFDGPRDFTAHDVLAGAARLREVPVRVSCGTSDPFLPGVRALLAALPAAEHELGPGGHDLAWWHHAAPAQLAFAGRHLAAAAG